MMIIVAWAIKSRTTRKRRVLIIWLHFNIFLIFLSGMTQGGYKRMKLILLLLRCVDWSSCRMICLRSPFSHVLIYALCFDTGHSRFSSAGSQTYPLYTRGNIHHMATVCLRCQISHKEWLHCLLREMLANWCSPLLDECYHRTQSSYWRELLFAIKRKL